MKEKNYSEIKDVNILKKMLSKIEKRISKLQSKIGNANSRNEFMNDNDFWFDYLPIGIGIMLGISMYLSSVFNLGVAITAGVLVLGSTAFSLIDTGLQALNINSRNKLEKHHSLIKNRILGLEYAQSKTKEQTQEKTAEQENTIVQKFSNVKTLNGKKTKKNAKKDNTIEF